MSLDDYEDGAQWRATFRDPSYVRKECPVLARLIKDLAKAMKSKRDPEDWGQELMKLVRRLSAEDRAHLPHEVGFIEQLKLSRAAAARLLTKLGFPEGLFEAAHDSPSTFLELILFAVEAPRSNRRKVS
jgi:hypothetical protein